MTRPKVDPANRQRTAAACNSCKRRKQKCNGLQPCNTCTRRSLTCVYGDNSPPGEDGPPPKRQMLNAGGSSGSQHHEDASVHHSSRRQSKQKEQPAQSSRATTSSGQEEAVVYTSSRMLQDPSGRLLYIGDSATLSYLQLIRMIVENVAGPSPFTTDPGRHRIVETSTALSPNIRHTHLLPDPTTARVLVDAFFLNTSGLVEVFHRRAFFQTLESCYSDPLTIDPSWLCLLHLVFAIGLVLATPPAGSPEAMIIQKLRSEEFDRAEMFFHNAKSLKDPSTGFEDAGFWSVQALLLMTLYTLAVVKRNAAYAYYGMAVRSAFALGLHREETMVIFSAEEQAVRRNLWRSLFVLDKFLSASLGRPAAIDEDDCSGDVLTSSEKRSAQIPSAANMEQSNSLGLEATVRSCHVIGVVLKKVYQQRKISTKLAQEIADECKGWPRMLDPSLHWKQASSANPSQGIAIMHVNLFYAHSMILLTRPFFLFLFNKTQQEVMSTGRATERQSPRMKEFSETCVTASCHSIVLIQNALDGNYLPRRNPFVFYFIFAASLILLSNDFARLHENPASASCIDKAIYIMQYCGTADPAFHRAVYILTTFRDVNHRRNSNASPTSIRRPSDQSSSREDSLNYLFTSERPSVPTYSQSSSSASPRHSIPVSDLIAAPPPPQRISPPLMTTALPGPAYPPVPEPATSVRSRESFEAFLDLQNLSGAFNTGRDTGSDHESGGEGEIDFESLWKWPMTPAAALNPLGLGTATQVGSVAPVGAVAPPVGAGIGVGPGFFDGSFGAVQGVSDSSVPLFGLQEFIA